MRSSSMPSGRLLAVFLASVVSASIVVAPPVAGQVNGSYLAEELSGGAAPISGAAIALESVDAFEPAGGEAVVEPGTPREESISYGSLDEAGALLTDVERPAPVAHEAGSFVAAATAEQQGVSPSPSPSSSPTPSSQPSPTPGEPGGGSPLPGDPSGGPGLGGSSSTSSGEIAACDVWENLRTQLNKIGLSIPPCPEDLVDPDTVDDVVEIIDRALEQAIGDLCDGQDTGSCLSSYIDLLADIAAAATDTLMGAVCPGSGGSAGMCAGEIAQSISDTADKVLQLVCGGRSASDCAREESEEAVEVVTGVVDAVIGFVCSDTDGPPADCLARYIETVSEVLAGVVAAICGTDDLGVCANDKVDLVADIVAAAIDTAMQRVCPSSGGSIGMCAGEVTDTVMQLAYAAISEVCGTEDALACANELVDMVAEVASDALWAVLHVLCPNAQTSAGTCATEVLDRIDQILSQVIGIVCGSTMDPITCANDKIDFVAQVVSDSLWTVLNVACPNSGNSAGMCLGEITERVNDALVAALNAVCSDPYSSGLDACVGMVEGIVNAITETLCDAEYRDASNECIEKIAGIVDDAVEMVFEEVCPQTGSSPECIGEITGQVMQLVGDVADMVCSSPYSSGTDACVDMVAGIVDDVQRTVYSYVCPDSGGYSTGQCLGEFGAAINELAAEVQRGLVDAICDGYKGDLVTCLDDRRRELEDTAKQLLDQIERILFDAACPGSQDEFSCLDHLGQQVGATVGDLLELICGTDDEAQCLADTTAFLLAVADQGARTVFALACPDSGGEMDAEAVQGCAAEHQATVAAIVNGLIDEICPELTCHEEAIALIAGVVADLIDELCPNGVVGCQDPYLQMVTDALYEVIEAVCPDLSCPDDTVQGLIALLNDTIEQFCGPYMLLGCADTARAMAEDLIQRYCPDLECGEVLAEQVQAIIYMAITGTCPSGLESCADETLEDCPTPPFLSVDLPEVIPPRCGLQMVGEVIDDFRIGAEVPVPGQGIWAETATTDGFTQFEITTSVHGAIFLAYIGDERVGVEQASEPDPILPPAAPQDLAAAAQSSKRIGLTWSDVSDDEEGFEIHRSTGSAWIHVGTVGRGVASYTDRALTPETTYTYRVLAYNSAGNSPFSNEASATTEPPPPPPAAPSGLSATATSHRRVDLTWSDDSATEDGFRIERSADSGATWTGVGDRGPDATGFSDTGLAAATTYTYRVFAYNDGGDSASSNEASVTTMDLPPAPAAPSGVQASAVSQSRIDLSWTDASSNEDGFTIGRSTSASGPFGTIATLGAGRTSYADSGLTASTTYYYVVGAFNDGGSNDSGTVSATTDSPPPPPAAPSGLSANTISSSRIDLYWSDNSSNEDSFRVERATSAGGPFTEVAQKSAGQTYHSDASLSASTTYYYRVSAVNDAGASAYSNTASATTSAPPPPPSTAPNAPTSLWASTVSASQINLYWGDNSSNESGFRVERATSSSGPFNEIAQLGANSTFYGDSGLTSGTTYHYRVRAVNAGGFSGYSNQASATTSSGGGGGGSAPASPSDLSGVGSTDSEITITWRDNSSDETGFEIERAAQWGSFVSVASTASNVTSYRDKGLSPDSMYRYRVRAFNANGSSGYSNEAVVGTPDEETPGNDEDNAEGAYRMAASSSPKACNDPAFKRLRHKGEADGAKQRLEDSTTWRLRRESIPGYLADDRDAVEFAINRGTQYLKQLKNTCGTGGTIPNRYVHKEGGTSTQANIDGGGESSKLRCTTSDLESVTEFGKLPQGVLGVACSPTYPDGRVADVDIRINNNKSEFEFFISGGLPEACEPPEPEPDPGPIPPTDPPPAAPPAEKLWDLRGLMTHEIGHGYGLDHVSEEEHGRLTMSKHIDGACLRRERTLGKGDIKGLKNIYG